MTLRLWDLESGEGRPLRGQDGPVIDTLLLPDGRRALSWSEDRTLRLWELAERHEIKRFVGDDFITTVVLAVPPRGRRAGGNQAALFVKEANPDITVSGAIR